MNRTVSLVLTFLSSRRIILGIVLPLVAVTDIADPEQCPEPNLPVLKGNQHA